MMKRLFISLAPILFLLFSTTNELHAQDITLVRNMKYFSSNTDSQIVTIKSRKTLSVKTVKGELIKGKLQSTDGNMLLQEKDTVLIKEIVFIQLIREEGADYWM